jgi:hypothetical protein
MDNRIPKAYLPAYQFTLEGEKKFEDLLTDLCKVGQKFVFKIWDWDGYEYLHAVDAAIAPSTSAQGSAAIELRVLKKYQSRSDVEMLEALNYKRSLPTSPIWTRVMLGKVAPSALANHALAGIKYSADFKPNSGFKVSAESNQVQEALNRIVDTHQWWGMDSTGDIKFLN